MPATSARTLAPNYPRSADGGARIAVAFSLLAWLAVLVELFWR